MWSVDEKAVDSETRVPFVLDVCRATFEQLQQLLTSLFDSVTVHGDWPPPSQFSECLVSAVLSLLKLQVLLTYLLTYLFTYLLVVYC